MVLAPGHPPAHCLLVWPEAAAAQGGWGLCGLWTGRLQGCRGSLSPEPSPVSQPCMGSGMWKLDVGRGVLVAVLSLHLFACPVPWAPSHHPA